MATTFEQMATRNIAILAAQRSIKIIIRFVGGVMKNSILRMMYRPTITTAMPGIYLSIVEK